MKNTKETKQKVGFLFKELYEGLSKEQYLKKKVINREVYLYSFMALLAGMYFFTQERLLLAGLCFIIIIVALQVRLHEIKKIEKEVFAKWKEYYALSKEELSLITIKGTFEMNQSVEDGFSFRFLSSHETDVFMGQLSAYTLDELQAIVEEVEEKEEEGIYCFEEDLSDFKGNTINLEKTLIQTLYIHKENPLLDYIKRK